MAAWCAHELGSRLRHPHRMTVIEDVSRLESHQTALAEADVLVGWPLTQAIAERASSVKLVQVSGAGVDGLRLDLLPRGVRVANTYNHEIAIAEYVIMAMLMLKRRPCAYDARLREGNWDGSCIWGATPVLEEIYRARLLLIGTGHIAREVAVRARAFGMKITAISRTPAGVEGFDEVLGWDAWPAILGQHDFIVPCCPLTKETEGLFGEREFALMKPSACFINMTRGRVVDEEALYTALKRRRIAGAAIDVWYLYPSDPAERRLPSKFPFHELDNVLMSPHNCGWTRRTIMNRVEDMAENINRLADGRDLINLVR
jgi:phosphoglycerate dehydrogenase-like enzyme